MHLNELTAHEIHDMLIKTREVSALEVTASVLNRIDAVESKIKSFISIQKEQAIEQAKEVDKKLASGEQLPHLAGIPIAIKDNIIIGGIPTTCASKMLENFIPPYNATVVNCLMRDNPVLIGKTNMDEFGMGSSTETSHFGPTHNPWDLERVPGGPSGGAAAAIAANETIVALGSDTGGSIRQPAAFCGVVGLKPTYGRVSRFGLVAYASSLDQIGPITKDVRDSAILMNYISGHDPLDSTSADRYAPNYLDALVGDVRGVKIGVPCEYFTGGIDEDVKAAIHKSINLLCELGASSDSVSLPHTEYAVPTYYVIATAEASANLARYDGVRYGHRSSSSRNLLQMYKKTRSEGFGME
ncbi:Asp-tRNA(Asn)/Glu-tRNA(Gln) amidotransferase subunit GatA, partial [bacterium]|nr:Asp-tRNA(Asn)/Glu-tRNA(Gln) amidotransferase subunit GatA [bacterium]